MNKSVVGIGVFLLIIGIVLTVLPLIYVPQTTTEAYDDPKSSVVFDQPFDVPPSTTTHTAYLDENDTINIQFEVTSGGNLDINFRLNDGSTTYLDYTRITSLDEDFTVPISSNYNFVFDNSFSTFTSKGVDVSITKQWTEIAYRDVTEELPLLPFEVLYVGIVLTFIGVGVAIFGAVKK